MFVRSLKFVNYVSAYICITAIQQIAVQNNAIRTKYVKAKIDKTQQNIKCRLWDNRDETINNKRME